MEKKYYLLFVSIFSLLVLILLIFFYFNLYLVILLALIILICSIVYFFRGGISEDEEAYGVMDKEDEIEETIMENDESFSTDTFYVYVKDVINLICRSYSKRNINYLKGFLGNDLINRIKGNIDTYHEDGYTRTITGINYRECKLSNYYIQSGYEYIEVDASLSKIDCLVISGVVVSGEKTNGSFLDYKLVFCRKLGEYQAPNVINCPVCGSNGNSFVHGKCNNCSTLAVNLDGFYLIKMDEI